MPSASLTDPIGPRSVDEMLGVVYGRADRLRRRRAVQRLGGGVAAVALALGAFVTLGQGDDSAQLRVVDDPAGRQETSPPESSEAEPGGTGELLNSYPAAPSDEGASRTPPTTAPAAPPVTSPSKMQADAAASLEAWMRVDDAANDSVPEDWYYDVVGASMEFDPNRNVVVFTTRYRSPDGSPDAGRGERLLQSAFDYGTHTYAVDVREAENRLGAVTIDGSDDPCGACTARFDAPNATLVVTVPLDVLNAHVARHDDSPPLGSGSEIAELMARTARIDDTLGEVEADVTGQGRVQ